MRESHTIRFFSTLIHPETDKPLITEPTLRREPFLPEPNIFVNLWLDAHNLFNTFPEQLTMNPSDPLMQPLSLDELNILDSFLISEQTPPESLYSIEMLDGYITATIAGPQAFDADDLMAAIWDKNKILKPEFASSDEEEGISELIVRHNNSTQFLFDDEPENFVPLFERVSYESEDEKMLAVEEWAMGFLSGIELVYDAWAPLFDDKKASLLVMPMFMLGKVSDEFGNLSDEEMLDLSETIAGTVIGIHSFWQKKNWAENPALRQLIIKLVEPKELV